jgi:uncharacterized RDD family membrane protein YckC
MDTPNALQVATLPCGLIRRLAAIFYDSLLLGALWMGATFPLLILTHGEAVPAGDPAYTFYLLLIGWVFFGWFWTRGGQTLGMRAWRIQVQTLDGLPIGWRTATFRYLAALLSWLCLGLGFLWQWVGHDRLTWHDRLSRTRLVVLAKAT